MSDMKPHMDANGVASCSTECPSCRRLSDGRFACYHDDGGYIDTVGYVCYPWVREMVSELIAFRQKLSDFSQQQAEKARTP